MRHGDNNNDGSIDLTELVTHVQNRVAKAELQGPLGTTFLWAAGNRRVSGRAVKISCLYHGCNETFCPAQVRYWDGPVVLSPRQRGTLDLGLQQMEHPMPKTANAVIAVCASASRQAARPAWASFTSGLASCP